MAGRLRLWTVAMDAAETLVQSEEHVLLEKFQDNHISPRCFGKHHTNE